MLSFAVYTNGQPASSVNLAGAYLVGSDDVPLRAEISFDDGLITCEKRAAGPAGLALLWEVAGAGTVLLETVRVPERDRPYILQVELARARLLRIHQKVEDWGLIEFDGVEELLQGVNEAREKLILALQADQPQDAARLGGEALTLAVAASERLSAFHAALFLARRYQYGGFSRRVLGCSVPTDQTADKVRDIVPAVADFVTIPIVWRDIEPNEQSFNWRSLDAWVDSLSRRQIPMHGSALLSFHEKHVPDWLYIWEHDFDTIRDLAFEHVRRVIGRYGQYIQTWDVISGIHATNCFTFSFEQLMELTRMTAALAKQAAPNAYTIINVVAPWGEYYARNQRTIPPTLYADMVVSSGVNFDGFGLQFYFGPCADGMFVRDMFQISSILDTFSKSGKPLHITAVQVPSGSGSAPVQAGHAVGIPVEGGVWHEAWSEPIQSEWLRSFLEIALSKPFVETVSWHGLADTAGETIPHGGLLRGNYEPKAAFNLYAKTRADIRAAIDAR